MPTNILHSTNSAVSASLTHMHSSENVNYRESFVTQPNTLAGLNRSPCMLDLCTGFAILMLSKRKGSSSSRNVWYLPGSSELHFVWPNPSWSKVRIKGPFKQNMNVNCPTFFWMQCCLGPERPRWWVPQEGTLLCLSSTWHNLDIQWNFCESGTDNPNHWEWMCLEI